MIFPSLIYTVKIWGKVVEKRLRLEIDLSKNQFGLCPKSQQWDQLCKRINRTVMRKMTMVFIYLENAYDKVPRGVLLKVLKKRVCVGKITILLIK